MNTVNSKLNQFIRSKESLLFLLVFFAGVSLFGWFSSNLVLASFSLKYKPISPIIALTFIALSILFTINTNFGKSRLIKSIVTILLTIIILLFSMIILNYF